MEDLSLALSDKNLLFSVSKVKTILNRENGDYKCLSGSVRIGSLLFLQLRETYTMFEFALACGILYSGETILSLGLCSLLLLFFI